MKCAVSIDWLSFTVKGMWWNDVIQNFLGMDPDLFQDLSITMNGYQRVKAFNSIYVCFQPRENEYFKNMGVNVSMSGTGCRTFENFSSFAGTGDKESEESKAFQCLFAKIDGDANVKISRLDVACDDKEGYLDMEVMEDCVEYDEIRSRLKKRDVHKSKNGKKNTGKTIYIGSESSDFRIRIYDKAKQMNVEGHWIRVEMVLRGRNANGFVSELLNDEEKSVGKLAAEVLNDKFTFIENDDSNISRCSVCPWWRKFVETLESVHLVTCEAIQHNVDKIMEWVDKQVAPSLFIISKTLGFDSLKLLVESVHERVYKDRKKLAVMNDWHNIHRQNDTQVFLSQVFAAV